MIPEFLFKMFSEMPRQGVGSNPSTRRAFKMLTDLPPRPLILDIGCGSGMQTLELARLSGGSIAAIDIHTPYLHDLKKRASEANINSSINIIAGLMFAMPFRYSSFDLIWSEGAIFVIGFADGLKAWMPLIKDSGFLVVSEFNWIKEGTPDELHSYLIQVYPSITDIEGNIKIIKDSGYKYIGGFTQPESDWWDNYYNPLKQRIDLLRHEYGGNQEAMEILNEAQLEIKMYKKYSAYYGHSFYVMRTN